MVRLNIIVEGHTEETFVRDMLVPHLGMHGVFVSGVRRVETGRKKGKIFRGGVTNYSKAKKDIQIWMKQEKDAWFSTMFDLYALPEDFPGMSISKKFASRCKTYCRSISCCSHRICNDACQMPSF